MTMILEQTEKALENQFPTTVLSQIEDDHQSILPTRQKRTIFGNHVRFVVLGLTMICSALITANTSTIFFTVICMDKEVEDDNVLLLSSMGANASFCNQFNDLFSWAQCKNALNYVKNMSVPTLNFCELYLPGLIEHEHILPYFTIFISSIRLL